MEDVLGLGGKCCHAVSSADAPPDVCPSKCGLGASHHLCFFCIISALCFFGGVWGGLGLFTDVFLPLVEFCHSGRRAGVSVGRMGTHCAVPRGKTVSVREMMEMCGWTDI